MTQVLILKMCFYRCDWFARSSRILIQIIVPFFIAQASEETKVVLGCWCEFSRCVLPIWHPEGLELQKTIRNVILFRHRLGTLNLNPNVTPSNHGIGRLEMLKTCTRLQIWNPDLGPFSSSSRQKDISKPFLGICRMEMAHVCTCSSSGNRIEKWQPDSGVASKVPRCDRGFGSQQQSMWDSKGRLPLFLPLRGHATPCLAILFTSKMPPRGPADGHAWGGHKNSVKLFEQGLQCDPIWSWIVPFHKPAVPLK